MAVASVSTAIAMVEDQDQMFVCTIAQTRASFLRLRKFSARQPDAYCERENQKKTYNTADYSIEHLCCKYNKKNKKNLQNCLLLKHAANQHNLCQRPANDIRTDANSNSELKFASSTTLYKIHFQVTQTWNCFC